MVLDSFKSATHFAVLQPVLKATLVLTALGSDGLTATHFSQNSKIIIKI